MKTRLFVLLAAAMLFLACAKTTTQPPESNAPGLLAEVPDDIASEDPDPDFAEDTATTGSAETEDGDEDEPGDADEAEDGADDEDEPGDVDEAGDAEDDG